MLLTGIRPADFLPFAQAIFGRDEQAKKAAPLSQRIPSSPIANDKAIQRLMAEADFQEVLLRLFDEEAPFYLADVTEISRRQAKREFQELGAPARLLESAGSDGEKPLVLDREFRYLWLYEAMAAEGMPFVVRLNTGNRARITDGEGKPVALWLRPGEQVFLEGVYYLGKVRGNLAGVWEKGWREPLWVFTSLAPAEGRKV